MAPRVEGFNPRTDYLSFFWSKERGMKNMKWSEAKNVYMLSGVLQMGYRWKALMMHQGPNQIPTAVVVAKNPKKGISLFSTGTYPPSGCRYTGIVRIIHESRQKKMVSPKCFSHINTVYFTFYLPQCRVTLWNGHLGISGMMLRICKAMFILFSIVLLNIRAFLIGIIINYLCTMISIRWLL